MATSNNYSVTIKRYNSLDGWDIIRPITVGQNIYGSGTNATTPLLNSNDKIDSAFLSSYVSSVNGSSGAITNVAKTNVDNAFSTTQTMYGSDDTPLNLRANHSSMSNIALFNSSGTRLGNIGANNYVPYWWGGQGNNGQIALISDIPSGDVDVTINGTATSTVQTLSNIIVGTTTYKNPTTFTGSSTTTGTPSGTTTVATSLHNHTITLSGTRTTSGSGTTARRKLTIAGSSGNPSGTIAVASSGHNHTFTATGSLS